MKFISRHICQSDSKHDYNYVHQFSNGAIILVHTNEIGTLNQAISDISFLPIQTFVGGFDRMQTIYLAFHVCQCQILKHKNTHKQ